MCEFGAEILECLRRIERVAESDKYEMIGIWTIGGGNGNYILKSPVNTEAEWALYAFSVTSACNILLSMNPASNALATNASASYGLGGGNESNPVDGLFVTAAAATTFTPSSELYWQPIGRGSSVYALVSGLTASQAAFVMVAWLRLLNREIPGPVRQIPMTHTGRQSTRFTRTLPAESAEVAGFQEQYPLPGGGFYQHNVTPAPTDPASLRESAISQAPTQADIIRAKLRGRTGNW